MQVDREMRRLNKAQQHQMKPGILERIKLIWHASLSDNLRSLDPISEGGCEES